MLQQKSVFDNYQTRNQPLWLEKNPITLTSENEFSNYIQHALYRKKYDKLSVMTDSQLYENYLTINGKFINLENLKIKRTIFMNRRGLRISTNSEDLEIFGSIEIIQKIFPYFAKLTIQDCFTKHYQIIKLQGKGTQAKVYKIERKKDKNIFAAKIYRKYFFTEQHKLEGLFKELNIMRKLNHPNIIKFYECYEDDKFIILVTDYFEGGDLQSQLKNLEYTERMIKQISWSLLSMVDYLHNMNIIHRDIKLENLLFKSKDNSIDITLIDFGLADYYNEECKYNFQKCGTLGYVAPEVLKNYHYDKRVDIFSIGIILFTLLSGRFPFHGYKSQELLYRNQSCLIDFTRLKTNGVNIEAINLTKSLLESNYELRLTAQQALQHSWFKEKDEFIKLFNSKDKIEILHSKLQDELITTSPGLKDNQSQTIDSSPLPYCSNQQSEQESLDDNNQQDVQLQLSQEDSLDEFKNSFEKELTPTNAILKYQKLLKKKSF